MINKIINYLSTMKFATIMLLLFAFSIGYATFIENDFGAVSAQALIYKMWWFELIILSLAISLILNIFKRKLFRKEKLATLMFHFSFITIILGAAVTRYVSYEGMMVIKEGESQDVFLSSETFLSLKVHDEINQFSYDQNLNLSSITKKFDNTPILKNLFSNYFKLESNKLSKSFSVEYVDFLTNVKDSVITNSLSGMRLTSSLENSKKGTDISIEEMTTKDILFNEELYFGGVNFTLNNPNENSVNFSLKEDQLICLSDFDITVNTMPPTGNGTIYKKGEEFFIKPMSLLEINGNRYMFADYSYKETKEMFSVSENMSDSYKGRTIDALVLNVKSANYQEKVTLTGRKGIYPNSTEFELNGLNFTLSYGPIFYKTPFQIHLKDFQLETYPGSMSPSSFASEVEVIDGNKITPYRIFMNNILDYKGFRFFQASYEEDESGTILSVNHDFWGTLITYIGYFFMMLGMILVFFYKKTRFNSLTERLNKLKSSSLLIILFFFISFSSYSDEVNYNDSLKKYSVDINHSNTFENLLVQNDGRIKPISTLSSEFIRKISRSEKLYGLNTTQIYLGIMSFPEIWNKVPLIKVQNKQLQYELNSESDLISFVSFFDKKTGRFIFEEKINTVNAISDRDKSKYENELLKVVERFNVLYSILVTKEFNSHLKIFPSENNFWKGEMFVPIHQSDTSSVDLIKSYLESVQMSTINNKWGITDTIISIISDYQTSNGGDIIPQKWKIDLEILYNKIDVFSLLFKWYFFAGLILLIFCIVLIFYNKDNQKQLTAEEKSLLIKIKKRNRKIVFYSAICLFIINYVLQLVLEESLEIPPILWFITLIFPFFISLFNQTYRRSINVIIIFRYLIYVGWGLHTLGLIAIWIISNHAPWTNGYEAMIYTVWATMFAGIIFGRKSDLTLATTTLVSSMLLLFAFVSFLDPTITNVVPVLNSYWLMIHVSIIVASYGFFVLGAFLGLLSLILTIIKTKKTKSILELKISELTIINEKSLIIGVYMLTIGTFLGGVWANESWGRYWGWDPKEAWALVSVLVYAFILHMRFIPGLKSKMTFNIASVFAIYSILMTFFGVNHLLSGLHSYAAGDDVGIPVYVWISVFIVIVITLVSSWNDKRIKS